MTFGIKPTLPEIGFGYLKIDFKDKNKIFNLISFIEKPKRTLAEEFIKLDNYLWNSGIFLFKAIDMINAFKKHAPDILSCVESALKKGNSDLGFLRVDPEAWSSCRNLSVDYAIMEKTKNLCAVKLKSNWSDLGNWNTVWQEMNPNKKGVSISKNAYELNCTNSLLYSDNDKQIIAGIGLKDIIAISTTDAVLISKKDMIQDLKKMVESLKFKNISQSEISPKDYRPWGWFLNLVINESFKVKQIYVNPGAKLSLQSHKHRSEHWTVVKGKATVTIDKNIKVLLENESTYVPIGAIHRLENFEKKPLIIIEVQIGKHISEDDIIRYSDIYYRN